MWFSLFASLLVYGWVCVSVRLFFILLCPTIMREARGRKKGANICVWYLPSSALCIKCSIAFDKTIIIFALRVNVTAFDVCLFRLFSSTCLSKGAKKWRTNRKKIILLDVYNVTHVHHFWCRFRRALLCPSTDHYKTRIIWRWETKCAQTTINFLFLSICSFFYYSTFISFAISLIWKYVRMFLILKHSF